MVFTSRQVTSPMREKYALYAGSMGDKAFTKNYKEWSTSWDMTETNQIYSRENKLRLMCAII